MRLSCADFTFPLLPHPQALHLIRMLGIEGLDLGLFAGRSHIRPEQVRADIPMWAGILQERLAQADLQLADFFFQPSTDFADLAVNHPDPGQQAAARALFADMLELAHRLAAPGMTMLPGVRFGDESPEASIRRSAEALKWRVDAAASRGLAFSVEGHLGSIVDTPEKLTHLLDLVPGLTLTLDYTHFIAAGLTDADVEPLLPHARHFHCRGAAPGRLQTVIQENTIDYRRIVNQLLDQGYPGYFGLEYTWQDWQGCNRTDNLSETIQYRDLVRAVVAERSG